MQPATVTRFASRYLDDCGIDATIHQLRHAFATEVYRASRDLRLCQELMGHAHPNTTAIYAAYSPGDAASVVEGLGPWAADRKRRSAAAAPPVEVAEVSSTAIHTAPAEPRPPELAFILDAFKADQTRQGLAAWTVKARVQLAIRVESRLMPKVALEASTDDLADFVDAQLTSAATRYTYIAHLRAFYGWAKTQGHIATDPSTGLSYVLRQKRAAAAEAPVRQ